MSSKAPSESSIKIPVSLDPCETATVTVGFCISPRLTTHQRLPIVKPNWVLGAIIVTENLIKTLESKVDDLVELSTQLKAENMALKKRVADLQHDKRNLTDRHRKANEYIERSISRLQKLEGN